MKSTTKILWATIIGLIVAFITTGCATTGGSDMETGTLTISGISNEYNGKFISGQFSVRQPNGTVLNGEARITQIVDGKVNLPVVQGAFRRSGYLGNDTVDVQLRINDTNREDFGPNSPVFIVPSVQFENGISEAEWNEAFMAGIIFTINNIPERFHNHTCHFFVDLTGITGNPPVGRSDVRNQSSITVKILRDNSGNYLRSDFSGTKSLALAFTSGTVSVINPNVRIPNVSITNGRANINLPSN